MKKELSAEAVQWLTAEQKKAFSPEYAGVFGGSGDTAFFPGCSMMGHSAALTLRVYEHLRTVWPDLALCTCCCGGPSLYVGLDKYFAVNTRLKELLAEHGIKRLVTCCPNCRRLLAYLPGVEIVPVWQTLRDHPPVFAPPPAGLPVFLLHDPCPTRLDAESQEAVRRLLDMAGFPYREYARNRKDTICCGRKNVMYLRDPETAAKIRDIALARDPGRDIVTWCFSCIRSFTAAGCRCLHVLEALFSAGDSAAYAGRCPDDAARWQERRLLAEEMRRRG